MTFRERLAKEHPETIQDWADGGCEGCPDDYGYDVKINKELCTGDMCTACWDRQIPEPQDVVSHPAHYCYSKYEPRKVIRDWGLNFNLGNVVKYVARAGRKDDILQELKKARQYLDFEIEEIENERGL